MKIQAKQWKGTGISHLSLFWSAFLIGAIGILIWGRDIILQSSLFGNDTVMLFELEQMNRKELLFFVLRERWWVLPAVFLLTTTYLGKVSGYLLSVWYGMNIGIVTGATMVKYGLGGIFLMLASAFPHYLIFIPVIVLSIKETKTQKKPEKQFWIRFWVLEILVIAGCVVESYINPLILEKIIRLYVR